MAFHRIAIGVCLAGGVALCAAGAVKAARQPVRSAAASRVGAATAATPTMAERPAGTAGQAGDSRGTGTQPRFFNARIETRAVATGSFASAVSEAVGARQSAGWIGYAVPMVAGRHHICDSGQYASRTYLEGRPEDTETSLDEDTAEMDGVSLVVLVRAEGRRRQKIRVFSSNCEIDAGGLPVAWLTGVEPAESVAWLQGLVTADESTERRHRSQGEPAVMAIALHRDASAQRSMEKFASAGQPEKVRKQAIFWLAAARGRAGFEALRRLLATETSEDFRHELVFPISMCHQPEVVDTLMNLAREDGSTKVRKQAMFWLGQKAGERVGSALSRAADDDPDTGVQKQAVFALSQMRNGEGVPRLIEVTRSNKHPAVRKQAMFWLGQSDDPRALNYLEEVLRGK
jgi:hypothetical protein